MIQIENCEDFTTVVRPWGNLDLISSFHLRHVVSDILGPGLDLVIDLQHVGMIDATGMSALIGSARRIRASGGKVQVINVKPRVRWLFQTFGFDRLIEAVPSMRRPSVV